MRGALRKFISKSTFQRTKLMIHSAMLFTDIIECTLGIDKCADTAVCTNTNGSYACLCGPGFAGDGLTCTGML